jgi:PGF-CTERM protein
MINMRKAVTTIGMAAILLLVISASSPAAAEASATRDLLDGCVDPNTEFTVTISASDYGAFGRVIETLCDGWAYQSSSLDPTQVEVSDNTVTFKLVGETSFTYTVQASGTAGECCSISGILKDYLKNEYAVTGDNEVCVCDGDATTIESPDGGESTGGVVVTTPVAMPTATGTQPVSEEAVTSAPSVTPTESMTPVATSTKKLATKPDAAGIVPGFGAMFAIVGLLAVAYMLRRR